MIKFNNYIKTYPIKKPIKKLAICIVLINTPILVLSGCQSVPDQLLNKNDQTQLIFSQNPQLFNQIDNPSVAHNSKAFLLHALRHHLEHEQTIVSQIRYQVFPYISNDDIEAEDKSLFRTFFELVDYQDKTYGNHNKNRHSSHEDEADSRKPYRTKEAYLNNHESELYLRYDDEKNGTLPSDDYDITRQIGMSKEYIDRNSALYYYAYSYDDCVIDYSEALDELVEKDATFSINDDRILPLKKKYNTCVTDVNKKYQVAMDNAIGYQKTYAPQQQQCASRYHDQVDSILSPNRNNLSIKYDDYDSVYQGYRICYHLVNNRRNIEPERYTYHESTPNLLDYEAANIECTESMIEQQQALINKENILSNDPKKYASIYYNDFSTCIFDKEQNILYADRNSDKEYNTLNDNAGTGGKQYESGKDKLKDDIVNMDTRSILKDYRNMRAKQIAFEKEQGDKNNVTNNGLHYPRMISPAFVLDDFLQHTPKQIDAQNYYAYQPFSVNTVSRYQPAKQRYTALYSYDYDAPTYKASVQMPIEFDFGKAQLTFDPAAVLPFMAIMSSTKAPFPEDLDGKVVTFKLPEGMENIPTAVLQKSFLDAVQSGLSTLHPEHFTEFDLHNDEYGRQIDADRAIKLYLGSKQSGEIIGKLIKHLTYDLTNYVNAHPRDFPEGHAIKQTLDNWMLYNQGFQSKDVGSLLQLVEAIAPISFDSFNYFYFDKQGSLIGTQNRTDFASYLSQSSYSVVQQTRYDQAAFDNAPHVNELDSLFFTNRDSIDGNEWINRASQKRTLRNEGRYARFDYDLPDFNEEYDKLYIKDYAEPIETNDANIDVDSNDE